MPDGQVARYYEFKTNRPLYMDAKYRLTYDDAVVPKHYGWKQAAHFDEIERAFTDAKTDGPPPPPRTAKGLEGEEEFLKDLGRRRSNTN